MDPPARTSQTTTALAGEIAAASAMADGQARPLRVMPATTSTTQALPLPARGHGGSAAVPGAGTKTGETVASQFAGAHLLPGGEPSGESPFSPAADPAAPGDTRTGTSAAPAAETAPRSSPAPGVAQQVAEAMRSALHAAAAPGSLEVALHPEDLGRVRLVFTPAEAGLTISIQAERSETLEMLRRHIDLLERDLRDQGFANLSFQFAGGDTPGGRETPHPYPTSASARDTPAHPADAPGPVEHRPPIPGLSSGPASLDLRL